jgi:AcrR family transcriptional regulator
VAQGTFYNYFDSLPAAVEAVGELLLGEHFRTVLRVIADATDAAEVVARSDLQTLMLFAHRPDVGRLVFDSREPIDRVILFRDARSQLIANLQWGSNAGVFHAGDLQVAASVHIGAMIGASLDLHRGRLPIEAAPEIVGRLLRDLGVSKRKSARLSEAPQEFEPWRPLPMVPLEQEEC